MLNWLKIIPVLLLSSTTWALSFGDFSLKSSNVSYIYNSTEGLSGKALLKFKMTENSQFFFQFTGNVSAISLDQKVLSTNQVLKYVPDGAFYKMYVLKDLLSKGTEHEVEINFKVHPSQYVITNTPKKLLAIATQYDNQKGIGPEVLYPTVNWPTIAPANKISFTWPQGQTGQDYNILCNCQISSTGNAVTLDFGSTPLLQTYFHILPQQESKIESKQIAGINVRIMTGKKGFSDSRNQIEAVKKAQDITEKTLTQMSSSFGPYPHGKDLAIFLQGDYGQSMEFSGATLSSVEILQHELIHQWFATSIQPKTYRDICLDEAITVWLQIHLFKDNPNWIYKVPDLTESSPPQNIANTTGFYQGYSRECYDYGVGYLNLVDSIIKKESKSKTDLMATLSSFYKTYRDQFVSLEDFHNFLGTVVPYDWTRIFHRLILGDEQIQINKR